MSRSGVLVAITFVLTLACGSSSSSSTSKTSCFKVGERACPKNNPFSQAEVDACNRCLDKYDALLACDPTGGYTCVDGVEETTKNSVCRAQINSFESCFIDAQKP